MELLTLMAECVELDCNIRVLKSTHERIMDLGQVKEALTEYD